MKGWKLDAGQEGHRIIFRDYHKAILDIMIRDPSMSWTSAEMDEALKVRGIKISRASVIQYMKFLGEDGLATYTEETGKGGYHRIYTIPRTWDEVSKHIAIKIIEGLAEGLDLDLDWVLKRLLE